MNEIEQAIYDNVLKSLDVENSSYTEKELKAKVKETLLSFSVDNVETKIVQKYKDKLTKNEARTKLDSLVSSAEDKLNEAMDFAEAHSLEFGWNIAYGMGGWYGPDYESSSSSTDNYEWQSSSSNC